jgi:hypothetical protein
LIRHEESSRPVQILETQRHTNFQCLNLQGAKPARSTSVPHATYQTSILKDFLSRYDHAEENPVVLDLAR